MGNEKQTKYARGQLLLACVVALSCIVGVACADDELVPRDASTNGDGDGDGDGDGGPGDGDGDGDPGDGDGDPGDGDGDGDPGDGDGDGDLGDGDGDGDGSAELFIPEDCVAPGVNMLPELLSCTGLYDDIEAKDVGAALHEFTPAVQLWSDGAQKTRWIYLPEGTQIDVSDPDSWIFPIGTRLFKEFRWNGHRVETRLFKKETATLWLKSSYHWNDDETEATRFGGGEVDVDGETYYIPSAKECETCHKGRKDRALGFETLLLSMPNAEGMTLEQLVAEGLVSDDSIAQSYSIGDDGTGKAAAALGWLHVNCGVSCHNSNSTAEAYRTDMYLRLEVADVDGSDVNGIDPLATTIGKGASTPRWNEWTRITPGSPEDSLLYYLANTRDPANPKDQMPPIASRVVDTDGVALVEDWIRSLSAP